MSRYLIKLVRDGMQTFGVHKTIVYADLDREAHVKLLRAKLIEEAAEYVVDGTLDELGDVYDVLAALCAVVHGITVDEMVWRAQAKYNERGGFEQGVGMFGVAP